MRALFVCFGLLVFLFEILAYLLIFHSSRYDDVAGNTVALIVMGLIITAVGVGLILMNRLAAISFSAFFTFNALELIIGSIIDVPLPYTVINVFLGILMMVPAAATISGWKELRWTGRWRIGDDNQKNSEIQNSSAH